MTEEDFQDWWELHLSLFPWIGKKALPTTPIEWHSGFFSGPRPTLADASAASREMFGENFSGYLADHPREVVRRAATIARNRDLGAGQTAAQQAAGRLGVPKCSACFGQLYIVCESASGAYTYSTRCHYCRAGAAAAELDEAPQSNRADDYFKRYGNVTPKHDPTRNVPEADRLRVIPGWSNPLRG